MLIQLNNTLMTAFLHYRHCNTGVSELDFTWVCHSFVGRTFNTKGYVISSWWVRRSTTLLAYSRCMH